MSMTGTKGNEFVDQAFTFLCLVEGDNGLFSVCVSNIDSIQDLKKYIYREMKNGYSNLEARNLVVFKVDIDLAPQNQAFLPHIRIEDIQGRHQLDDWKKVSDFWSAKPNGTTLNILVMRPQPETLKLQHTLLSPDGDMTKCPRQDDHVGNWLSEIHSKLWNRGDLASEIFREVNVTEGHYWGLQQCLNQVHPNRDDPGFSGSKMVLSEKLHVLRTYIPPTPASSASQLPDPTGPVAEKIGMDDEDPGDVDAGLKSLFPTTIRYMDLYSLGLKNQISRFPRAALLRQEYYDVSEVIERSPKGGRGGVIIRGEHGTGKTTFLHFKIVESLIAGKPFLYQTITGDVYHVSQNVTKVTSWSSTDPIMAFVDGDCDIPPQFFLFNEFVQIITVSSGMAERWMREMGDYSRVTELRATDWSKKELLLAGIFIHPYELPYLRLKQLRNAEECYYFNPHQCFLKPLFLNVLSAKQFLAM